jgi:hypothetical protein
VGDLNGRVRRLEGRAGISESEGAKRQYTDERRAEIIAELEAFKARLRRMSELEREAWLNHPRRQAAFRELEEHVERRRKLRYGT